MAASFVFIIIEGAVIKQYGITSTVIVFNSEALPVVVDVTVTL